MINRILFGIILFFALFFPSLSHAATVQVEVIHSHERYASGERYPLAFRLKIQTPWSIHGTEAKDQIIPTALRFEPTQGLSIEEIRFPVPELLNLEYLPNPVEAFSGEVLALASLRIPKGAPVGERTLTGKLSYQACSTTVCLPPEEISIPVRVRVAPPGTETALLHPEVFAAAEQQVKMGARTTERPEAALWLTLVGLFFGGLALNLTPCIYPLIPITVSYFTGRTRRRSGAVILHACLYMIGLAITNAALGLSAALSGGMLGSALQSPVVLLFVALIMVALAMSFFGFWELRIPAFLSRLASKDYGGSVGSLFMGLTLGIVAAPCIGPFILGLLTYVGQRGDPFYGFLCFFVLSLGLGLPLSVLALFSGAISKLPLSGDWMLWVRKAMGWVLLGMAAYIAGPLIPSPLGRAILISAVLVAAAIHLAILDRTGMQTPAFRRFKKTAGLVLAAVAVISLSIAAGQREGGIQWTPYDVKQLDSGKRMPVMIDFYAEWCSPCRALDTGAFRDPDVVKLSRKFLPLRVDLTMRRLDQDEILARYRIRGVPTIVFLDKDGKEQQDLRVESLVDRAELLERMRQLQER